MFLVGMLHRCHNMSAWLRVGSSKSGWWPWWFFYLTLQNTTTLDRPLPYNKLFLTLPPPRIQFDSPPNTNFIPTTIHIYSPKYISFILPPGTPNTNQLQKQPPPKQQLTLLITSTVQLLWHGMAYCLPFLFTFFFFFFFLFFFLFLFFFFFYSSSHVLNRTYIPYYCRSN